MEIKKVYADGELISHSIDDVEQLSNEELIIQYKNKLSYHMASVSFYEREIKRLKEEK